MAKSRAQFRKEKMAREVPCGEGSEEVKDRLYDKDYEEESDASQIDLMSEISTEGSDAFMSEAEEEEERGEPFEDEYDEEAEYRKTPSSAEAQAKYRRLADADPRLRGLRYRLHRKEIEARIIWDDVEEGVEIDEDKLKNTIPVGDTTLDAKGFFELFPDEDSNANVKPFGKRYYRMFGRRGDVQQVYYKLHKSILGNDIVRHVTANEARMYNFAADKRAKKSQE